MTTLPAAGYFNTPQRTNSQAKDAQDTLLAYIRQMPGGAAETELTIAAGAITPTAALHRVDTEGDAAADDLTTIETTNLQDGAALLLRAVDPGRVVTVRDATGGAGRVHLHGADFVLDGVDRWLHLVRRGTDWYEVTRSHGADAAGARARLGLGSAATADIGASQGDVPALDANGRLDTARLYRMVGATPGAPGGAGLVPAPAAGDHDRLLAGDGTYKDVDTTLAGGGGHLYFPTASGNLLLQWGIGPGIPTGQVAVTFPLAYASDPIVMATPTTPGTSRVASIRLLSPTGVTIRVTDTSNGVSSVDVHWLAIGVPAT